MYRCVKYTKKGCHVCLVQDKEAPVSQGLIYIFCGPIFCGPIHLFLYILRSRIFCGPIFCDAVDKSDSKKGNKSDSEKSNKSDSEDKEATVSQGLIYYIFCGPIFCGPIHLFLLCVPAMQ